MLPCCSQKNGSHCFFGTKTFQRSHRSCESEEQWRCNHHEQCIVSVHPRMDCQVRSRLSETSRFGMCFVEGWYGDTGCSDRKPRLWTKINFLTPQVSSTWIINMIACFKELHMKKYTCFDWLWWLKSCLPSRQKVTSLVMKSGKHLKKHIRCTEKSTASLFEGFLF